MSFTSLPSELIHEVADYLDLRSVALLSMTCHGLWSFLTRLLAEHRHGSMYLAMRCNDLPGFQQELENTLQQLNRFELLPDEDRRHQDLYCVLLACSWILVVERDEADEMWWSEWTFLAQELKPAAELDKSGMAFGISASMMRMLKRAMQRRHITAVRVFCRETIAAQHAWSDPENTLGPMLASVYSNAQGLLWSTADRVGLLVLLTSATTVPLTTMLGLADPEMTMETMVAFTNSLGYMIEFTTASNDFDGRRVLSFIDLLGACAKYDRADLFNLLVDSYLVGTALYTPQTAHPNLRIDFPEPPQLLVGKLTNRYTSTYGVSISAVQPFLKYLSHASFEHVFLPCLLGLTRRRAYSTFLAMELSWLLSHVRLHPTMLHALAFNDPATLPHTPETAQLVLDHVPVDIASMHAHVRCQRAFLAAGNQVDVGCTQCRQLARAATLLSSSNLPSFTTLVWFVSYNPISNKLRSSDQRAVMKLFNKLPTVKPFEDPNADAAGVDEEQGIEALMTRSRYKDVPWLEYVTLKHRDFPWASGLPLSHERVTTTIQWYDSERPINRVDPKSALFAYLHEYRFDEAMEMVDRIADGVLTQSSFWLLREMVSTISTGQAQVPNNVKNQRLAGLARVTIALKEHGLMDVRMRESGEYYRLLEQAWQAFRPQFGAA